MFVHRYIHLPQVLARHASIPLHPGGVAVKRLLNENEAESGDKVEIGFPHGAGEAEWGEHAISNVPLRSSVTWSSLSGWHQARRALSVRCGARAPVRYPLVSAAQEGTRATGRRED